jgi:hypothetical protein
MNNTLTPFPLLQAFSSVLLWKTLTQKTNRKAKLGGTPSAKNIWSAFSVIELLEQTKGRMKVILVGNISEPLARDICAI